MREDKSKILIFFREFCILDFFGVKVFIFNSINFRVKNYLGMNGKWWGVGNDRFIFILE